MLDSLRASPLKAFLYAAAALALIAADVLFGIAFGWLLAAAAFLALLGWGAAVYLRARQRRLQAAQAELAGALESSQQRAFEAEQRLAEDRRQLETLMYLTRGLAEAQDEKTLMDAALSAMTGLVGALGCSFVPVDDWEQPLPAFTYGQLPEPVLHAWAMHLADGMLRQRCGSCSLLESGAGNCPLHPQEIGSAMTVYCLPLTRAGESSISAELPGSLRRPARSLGVFHLYLPAGRTLDSRTRNFLDNLLRETALAYENARMRAQELATLRQIQLLHAPESDFSASLGGLLENLKEALEADCVLVRTRPSADERLSDLAIQRGDLHGLEDQIDNIFSRVSRGESAASAPESLPVWLALPMTLPDGQVLGMLLAVSARGHVFHPRQKAILETVASQAALLVDNERLIRSLEYKVILQERARLAREIHDGLAQTLAFLKLQAAQMQTYLAQSDLARLSAVLKDNYHILAEAYLDTRQAIDNLRLTPDEGLENWLERILREFENGTGLTVERAFQPGAQLMARALSPEIQAQLVRIVQEALSNVRKHARPRRVWAGLHEWQGELVLEIGDDGQGFEAQDVPEIARYGLRGMRERAELIGADFQIISQAGQGTIVRLVLPASMEEGAPQ